MPNPLRGSVGQPSLAERQQQANASRMRERGLMPDANEVTLDDLLRGAIDMQVRLQELRSVHFTHSGGDAWSWNPSPAAWPRRSSRSGALLPTEPPPEVPEVPKKEPTVALSRKHYEAMAREIASLRPQQEGRVAASQHSTLNRLAYKLASVFEGDNPSFNRDRWLAACGVTERN